MTYDGVRKEWWYQVVKVGYILETNYDLSISNLEESEIEFIPNIVEEVVSQGRYYEISIKEIKKDKK